MAKKSFGKRFVAILATLALLISMVAMVGSFAVSAESAYTPKRVMSYTAGGTQIEGKMLITGSGSKFGAGKEVTVKGYYKIENYVNKNDTDHCVQIGSLSPKADCDWTPFELKYTTGDGNWLKFGFWYAQGTMSIADVTFEDAEGNVIYDMATDADLVAGTYDAAKQPATMGMWYVGYYGDKSEISCTVDPVYVAPYVPQRVMSYTAGGTQIEGKMLITGSGSKFGAGKDVTVKGYYKIENYVNKNDTDHCVQIGSLSPKADCDWTPFELSYTTGDSNWLKFGFWYAQGTLSIADITFEDAEGNVIYDMATDTALVAGTYDAAKQPAQLGMWYIGYYGDKSDISCTIDPAYVAPYEPQRVMSITSANGDVNSKMIITQSGTYLGAGKDVTVKGYYKIEDYAVVNADNNPGVLIKGANVGGNTAGWIPFEQAYTTGDSNWFGFEFWYATGKLSIADVTMTDADGKVIYDMTTDANLPEGDITAPYGVQKGMWYLSYYNVADGSVAHIDPVYVAPYAPKRVMSITSANGDVNSKMIITQSGTYLGAGKDVTVKGYYKIEDYAVVNADNNPGVLIKGANVGGNTAGWIPFEQAYTTGDSNWFGFEFWYATGKLSIADVTMTDAEGNVIYDMAADEDLPEGDITAPYGVQKGMWYLSYYNVAEGCVVHIDPVVEGGEVVEPTPDIGVVPTPTIPDMTTADANGYAPNRAFGIISTVDANPYVTWAVWGDDFVGADKYYIFANVQVSGFQPFEGATDAACSISLLAGSYSAVLGTWTADTNGWVALEDANGVPFSFEKLATIDDSVVLTFETKNAAANFMVADLIIADCNGNIIYSLANDKLLDLENDMRYTTSTAWDAKPFVANPDGPSLFPIRTKGHAEYVPNVSLSIAPKAWTPGHTPENSIIIRTNAAPFVAGETYTIRGKILVDAQEGFQLNANPRADFTSHTLGPIGSASICDTDGWVSLVYPNGDPIIFKGTEGLDYVKFNLYMTHGILGLADIVIYDSQGNAVYDTSKDEGLIGATEPITNEGWFDLGEIWRIALYGEEYSSCAVTVNENPVEHTNEDYDVPTFVETVTIPSEDEVPPTSGMAILLVAALATMSAGGAAVLSLKKKEN